MRLLLPLALLALLLRAAAGGARAQEAASGASLYQLYDERDVLAEDDPFERLAGRGALAEWARDEDDKPVADLLAELDELTVKVLVQVVLIGLDGTGPEHVEVSKEYLGHLLAGVKVPTTVIHADGAQHTLRSAHRVFFMVSHASPALTTAVNNALQLAIAQQPKQRAGPAVVSTQVLERVLEADQRGRVAAHTIYIISPALPVHQDDNGEHGVPYWYSADPAGGETSCTVTTWVSKSPMAWIDLGAVVQSRGPSRAGEGAVTRHSLPSLAQFRRANDFLLRELQISLASFVHRVLEHVIIPPLDHYTLLQDADLEVVLFAVTTRPATDLRPSAFDWNTLQQHLRDMHLPGRKITFRKATLTPADLQLFLLAYKSSIKTVAFHHPDEPAERRIDDEGLRERLLQSYPLAPSVLASSSSSRALPVVVFDIGEGPTLMSGQLASALGDMVIAVAGSQDDYFAQFQCGGKTLSALPSRARMDVTRATFAAVLQAAWGIAPSFQTWRSVQNATTDDYLFATGLTPFGPFSTALDVHAGIRDGVHRGILLSGLHRYIQGLEKPLQQLVRYDMQVADVLSVTQLELFKTRWTVFKRKLFQVGVVATVSGKAASTFYFLRSARYDFDELKRLLSVAQRPLVAMPENCGHEDSLTTSESLALMLILALAFLPMVITRAILETPRVRALVYYLMTLPLRALGSRPGQA